jgi:hypothetical protein
MEVLFYDTPFNADTPDQLLEILQQRDKDGWGVFTMHENGEGGAYLEICFHQNKDICLLMFYPNNPKDPSQHFMSDAIEIKASDPVVFRQDAFGSEGELPRYMWIPAKSGLLAALEYFNSKSRPENISWIEQ